MVNYAVIQEYEEKEETNATRNLIREARDGTHQLEAAVETSNKWQITDTSMLH
jgi:hypothetical protein